MLRWKSVDLGARSVTSLPWLAPGLVAPGLVARGLVVRGLVVPGLVALCLVALGSASLSLEHSAHAAPASPGFAVEHAALRTVGGLWVADARIECRFSDDSLEAMRNGVPLTVIVGIEVRRKRGRWWDETLAASEFGYRLESNVLTGRYRIRSLHDGQMRNFRSLDEMIDALGDLRSIPVIARNRLSGDERYTARIRARLDIEALPSPLRPIAYLSPDWRLDSGWFEWRIPQ